jgi:hypothetical protein
MVTLNQPIVGTTPDPTWATMLNQADTDLNNAKVELGGDLSGTVAAPTVVTATTTTPGKSELATLTEAVTGTDATRAVTPAALTAVRGLAVGVNAQTGTTYTPVLTDQGSLVTLSNAGAITVTLPQDSALAFPIGGEITFIAIGAGAVTFSAGAGATVNGAALTAAQWVIVKVVKRSANTWTVGAPSAGTTPDATTGSKGIVQLAGDLAGTAAAPTVAKIATATISGSPGTPSSSNFLRGDGTWSIPAGGGASTAPPYMVPKIGSYLGPSFISAPGPASLIPNTGAAPGCPIIIGANMTINAIVARVTVSEASTLARVLLYSSDSDGYPATLLTSASGLDCSTTGYKSGSITALALTPGLYWVFLRTNSPGGTVRLQTCVQNILPELYPTSGNGPLNTMLGMAADCGAYASPASTISAWTVTSQANTVTPWFQMVRSA